jgi:hydrogenase nickel incorporation protein HypA/HybF
MINPYTAVVHEVSVISGIVNAVLEELEKYDVIKVSAVDILIGDMTMLGDEQLTFAYEVVTRDTLLEGSKLNIEHESIRVTCDACKYDGPVKLLESGDYTSHKIPVMSCPECGGHIEVVAGQSCCVTSVDIEEA